MKTPSRAILVVLDSLGIGAAPDAARFGDVGANTLGHICQWCAQHDSSFSLPNLSRWGLGNLIGGAFGLPLNPAPSAGMAKLLELSPGKDTTTGHWEMAGTALKTEFPSFPKGFDPQLLQRWCDENSLTGWLCNSIASGTAVIDQFGEEHLRTDKPIVYTSADSVFQIACSEEKFGLERLYKISKSARKLTDPLGVGRIIARPFVGKTQGGFTRTENRRDFSVPPPSPNLLDLLVKADRFVAGVGKIEDIFAHRSVSKVNHTGRNETSLEATLKFMLETKKESGLIFTNLIDFDMLHGHRRNPGSYAKALMDFDAFLPKLEAACSPSDVLILTADHGNDPTFKGTDHTREYIPLLVWSPNPRFVPHNFGTCEGLSSIARLILECLELPAQLRELPDAQSRSPMASALGLVS